MRLGILVITAILALWGLITTIILVTDGLARRRYREQREVRDWTEKVEAMRRMADQEGDA